MEEDARHHIARRHIAENSAATPEAANDQRRQKLFIERARIQNDRAEYELFGSRGHTYHDPETGEVIADAQNPTIGLIERMRTELTYGQGEAERNAYADAYESRIMSLINDDGLELAQAQLIADFDFARILLSKIKKLFNSVIRSIRMNRNCCRENHGAANHIEFTGLKIRYP